jgi:hypothetical protein
MGLLDRLLGRQNRNSIARERLEGHDAHPWSKRARLDPQGRMICPHCGVAGLKLDDIPSDGSMMMCSACMNGFGLPERSGASTPPPAPIKAQLSSEGKLLCPRCGQPFMKTPPRDLLESHGDHFTFKCSGCGCHMKY